jgi:hypothetical protein
MPLKQRSTERLLIARDAQPSKHSQRHFVVEGGLALCDEGDRQPERKRTSAFA